MNEYFACFGLPGSFVLTGLLSLFSLLLALFAGGVDRWICFAAMVLSSVGDIFLMNFKHLSLRFPNYFVIGAVFFMLSHLVYASAFCCLNRSFGYAPKGVGLYTGIAVALAALVFFLSLMARSGRLNAYNLAIAVVYLAVISVNMCSVFNFTFHAAADGHPWRLLSAVGMFSFFLSDCFIGLNMLGGISRYGHLIWWYYPIGQILLLIGG